MTAKRNLLALACVGLLGGATVAQTPLFGGRPGTPLSTRPTVPSYTSSGGDSVLPMVPPPAAPVPTASAPMPPFGTAPAPDTLATDLMAAPAGGIPTVPGAAYSPWNPSTGGHGPVTYEGYMRTGPALNLGGSELGAIIQHGWTVSGGGRTLFFNQAQDAAWALDLGLSFTQNRGQLLDRLTRVAANEIKGGGAEFDPERDPNNQFDSRNQPVFLPQGVTFPVGIRAVRRTSVNFGIGRDWWMYGPGTVGPAVSGAWNLRSGFDIGGRWGTSSIDFIPRDDPGGTRRRQSVYHGVYVGSTLDWERQIGNFVFQVGVRAEWGYDWMNLLPPQTSDLHTLNCLLMLGLRY